MKLYEIAAELEAVVEDNGQYVNQDTGEVLNKDALDALALDFDEKVENCLLYIKNKQAEAEMIKAEIKKLESRGITCENKASWMNNYVAINLLKGAKFSTAKVTVKYTKSKSASPVFDWEKLTPDEYWKETNERTIDKALIRKDLLAGKTIPGWELNVKTNLKVA